MTAQIADALFVNGREYSIVAVENEWPFSPQAHGFKPVSPHTACWRGYYCRYSLTAGDLVLDSLYLGTGNSTPSKWGAIEPVQDDEMWLYPNVSLRLPYSGGIIAGREFLDEFYVHMGFQPAYAYEDVRELIFSSGRLVEQFDRSSRMARIRDVIARAATSTPPRALPLEEIERFVAKAFSTSYDDKWF